MNVLFTHQSLVHHTVPTYHTVQTSLVVVWLRACAHALAVVLKTQTIARLFARSKAIKASSTYAALILATARAKDKCVHAAIRVLTAMLATIDVRCVVAVSPLALQLGTAGGGWVSSEALALTRDARHENIARATAP